MAATKKQDKTRTEEQARTEAGFAAGNQAGTDEAAGDGQHENQHENQHEGQGGDQSNASGEGRAKAPDQGEQLYPVAELAELHRLPSWQSASLFRLMDWDAGKSVSETEFATAMAKLRKRPMGG